MKRYLIITTLDVRKQSNNREHHLIRHLAPRFEETYVVYRRRCDKAGWRQLLRDALVPGARVIREGSICYVEVNPLLNHYQGLARDVAGLGDEEIKTSGGGRVSFRWALYLLSSGLGIFKDISTIASLFYFTWRRAPGRFDACTALGPWAAAAARGLRRLGKVAFYAYADRDFEPGFIPTPLRRRWAAWLERTGLHHADLAISIGYRLAALRELQIGRPVHVITTGVDTSTHSEQTPHPATPLLIYTGNVTYWSGLDLVIECLPALRAKFPGLRLKVVGECLHPYRSVLEALVRRLDLAAAVEMSGRQPHARVPTLLAGASLGLALFRPVDLRIYAFPLKVLEYMAAGLPTIGTAGTETEDLLLRHDCGLTVPFDHDAFVRAVSDLLCDEPRRRAMSRNGRTAAQHFRWEDLLAREYDLLRHA